MFKIVPKASKIYEMSIDGDIRLTDGKECTLTTLNNEPAISLEIYGEERTVSIEWLRLITHFEVDLKKRYFFNVYFVNLFKWSRGNISNRLMVFKGKHPEYKPGFRIIPNFTRYAISKEGIIIDTYNITELTNTVSDKGYIYTNLYDPDRNKYRSISIHILVALAWVKNPNPSLYYMCNHIDGNKHNPHASNLEWTNHSGNNKHAFDNGLRTQNINCKILDIITKEIKEFTSLKDACVFMGINTDRGRLSALKFKRASKLVKNRFEVRLKDDNRPWLYMDINEKMCPGRYQIKVIYPNGEEKIFYDVKSFKKYFNIGISTGTSVHKTVSRVLEQYSDLNITIVDTYATKIIQGLCISSGIITEAESCYKLSNKIGIEYNTIAISLLAGETRVCNGYAFRYKTNKKWNTNFSEAINKPKCILAINKNGKKIECKSLRMAERTTGVDRSVITRSLKGLQNKTNWHFVYI